MSQDREQRIRERAYSLWQEDGCPEEREQEYWFRAAGLIDAEDDPQAPGMTKQAPL